MKKSLKLESLLHLEQLNQRLGFLIEEGKRVQNEEKIRPDSPFFAVVVLGESKGEKVYISDDFFPLDLINQGESASAETKQSQKKPKSKFGEKQSSKVLSNFKLDEAGSFVEEEINLKKREVLIELSKQSVLSTAVEDFEFKSFGVIDKEKQPFILFIKSLGDNKQWIAFLKKDKIFFKLQFDFLKDGKKDRNKEIFVINKDGQLFFHTKSSRIFKILGKRSPVRRFLEKLSQEQTSKKLYLKSHKRSGNKSLYYFQKWNKGDLLFVSKETYALPFLVWAENYYLAMVILFLIFCFLFTFFWLKFFHLVSAYNFLKRAILLFDKTGLLPVTDVPKNPLLYFYSNRRLFLNQREQENQNETVETRSLNFKDIVRQELEKLKSKYPRLVVREEFDSDVKIFGFERFLRVIIHELLLNALESMGGIKRTKIGYIS